MATGIASKPDLTDRKLMNLIQMLDGATIETKTPLAEASGPYACS